MGDDKKGVTPEALVLVTILCAMAWGCCMSVAILVGVLR